MNTIRTTDEPVVSVRLNNTKVTDAGLLYSKGLTRLEYLGLGGTSVAAAGVKELHFGVAEVQD